MTPIRTVYNWRVVLINVSTSDNMPMYFYDGEANTYEDACRAITQKILEICSSGEYAVRDMFIDRDEVM